MRSRRHHIEEHENHERWLVSYADFITLLFAFFVVMYAISSVNEGKYRVLSDTLDATFRATPRSSSIINIGEPARSTVHVPGATQPGAELPAPDVSATLTEVVPPVEAREFIKQPETVAQKVRTSLAPLLTKGTVVMRTGGQWVEIELKSQILFDSGEASLKKEALPVLRSVARAIAPMANRVQVEGYTDNTPISTAVFPSNWELSAARAASVVQLFSRSGVSPKRLAAVGYGEQRPKAANDTPQGRQQNRRVVVRISTVDDPDKEGANATAPTNSATPNGADRNQSNAPAPADSSAVEGTGQKVDFSNAPNANGESATSTNPAPNNASSSVANEATNTVPAATVQPSAPTTSNANSAAATSIPPQTPNSNDKQPVGDVEWIRTPPEPEGLDLN